MEEARHEDEGIDKIEANNIVVEVTDIVTGKVFRRNLPVAYLENSNGVVLSGENMNGTPVQIAFFSDTALAHINDLMGKGLDAPRCDHE